MRRPHSMLRLPLILMALASASGLAACSGLTPSADGAVRLPQLPVTIASSCARPTTLPTGHVLTQAEVEQLWSRDRAALLKCGWSLAALVEFYTDLQTRLAAADRSAR